MSNPNDADFVWKRYPRVSETLTDCVRTITTANRVVDRFDRRLMSETGTRLVDWIDHIVVPRGDRRVDSLIASGYQQHEEEGVRVLRHAGGLFPAVRIDEADATALYVKVDSVVDFAAAHDGVAQIDGSAGSPIRTAVVDRSGGVSFGAIERHGSRGFRITNASPQQVRSVLSHHEAFTLRQRRFDDFDAAFEKTEQIIRAANHDLGVDYACDLFFAAERRYWQSRNRAARIQKHRQDRLGLGWGNHDHHTYRSSRTCFARLISLLELMGFECRERFYGGAEAGWGAQVLEQPRAGIVIFADVDLSPREVAGDFAHDGLASRDELGTVGLWCALHGEAVFHAGMHHLECQFDFDAAREQLAAEGVETMTPFTDMEHLKQAFTRGETWPVCPERIDLALSQGRITHAQSERFREEGSIGSHLEILERREGYKGFNQTGISEIIRGTDPREVPAG